MEGLAAPSELTAAASACGMKTLALVDHRYLTGVVEFTFACKDAGIRPIYGLEIDINWQGQVGPIVLLVMDRAGWSNLCWLSSSLLLEESDTGSSVLDLDLLSNHAEGLLALSGGQRSILDFLVTKSQDQPALDWLAILHKIFPQRLYIEIQQHESLQEISARRLAKLAFQTQIPVIASQDVYYLREDQADLQQTLAAMRLNCKIKDLPKEAAAPGQAFFTTQQEMIQRFAWLQEAIKNTVIAAQRCQFILPIGETHFPEVPLPAGKSIDVVLRDKALAGAIKRYGKITSEIQQRLDHELETIAKRGYEPIFLIVEELLNFARENGVPISSRGSAASSLVAYCLEITNPEPLSLNLYFERFLNPARSSPPDIDTDLCSRRRDLVIQHVFETYGYDRVAMVGTINRFRPRSALGEVAKAFGLPPVEVRKLVERLPYFRGFGSSDSEKNDPFGQLAVSNPRYSTVFDHATALLRQPRHLSMHPGGIVVSPGLIKEMVPVMRSGGKGITITQLDLDGVEQFGLVKIDLLGIRGLSVLGDVAEAIYSWRRSEYKNAMQVLQAIPLDDAQTAESVCNGKTIGCFQIESPGMRSTLKEIQAESVDDIMAALALYRPGPLRGGLRDAFIRRFKGIETVEHIHPILAPLLGESYGVILYQEQVLRIAHELGGLSLADADLLRRAMSHFDPGEQMKTLKKRFLEGFQKRAVPVEKAEMVWEMMAAFAGYGFPKAHAASYAQVAWQAAWCKTHFPAEFMAAVLANGGGYYSQRVYLSEARRQGLRVKPPHINHSLEQFHVTYPKGEETLYMGLDQVFGLTHQTQNKIIAKRPFISLNDFLTRVDPRKSELDNLIRCGSFEGLGTIPDLIQAVEKGSWRKDQLALFDWGESSTIDWSLSELAKAQEEVLGVSVAVHPLELFVDQVAASGAISTVEAADRMGESIVIAGMRLTSRRTRTAKGESMLFLSIEDLEGMLEVVIFPGVYRQYREELSGSGPYLIRGMVDWDEERGDPWLRAEKVRNLGKK
jgi:DNA-directed DNA polymerase III PolC